MSAKNKSAASVQITAEQLLREAAERQLEVDFKKPQQKIADGEELAEFQLGKRQGVSPVSCLLALFLTAGRVISLRMVSE